MGEQWGTEGLQAVSAAPGGYQGCWQGIEDPEALPDTHNSILYRFCLHPGLSEDMVGTHPPGAHSLVAVSVGEWEEGCPLFFPLFCPTKGSPGAHWCLTPAPQATSQAEMSQAPQTITLFLAKDSGSFLSHSTHSQEVLGYELPTTILMGQAGLGAS